MRGYFGVAAYRPKIANNVGSLWRTADLYGAAFIATVGRRYSHQPGDTMHTPRHTPLHHYAGMDDLLGAENNGLPPDVLDRCHRLVQIPSVRPFSLNVAVAGSVVVVHRHMGRVRTAVPS